MTSPGPQGFPDYGRLFTQANVLYDSEINKSISAQTHIGPFFVGNVEHVGLTLFAYNHGARFTFSYFADAALAVGLQVETIDLRPGTSFEETIPVLGPWLQVTVDLTAYPDHVDFQLWHAAGPFLMQGGDPFGTVLISVDGVNVGANSAATDVATRAHMGWAQWSATMDAAAAWNHKLQVISFSGQTTTLEYTSTDTGRRSGLIFLPAGVAQIVSSNADAVPRARHVFLHALPGVQ
jgi:hypothetical protein